MKHFNNLEVQRKREREREWRRRKKDIDGTEELNKPGRDIKKGENREMFKIK